MNHLLLFQVIRMEFALHYNVKAIKGLAMKHLPPELKKQTSYKSLRVMFKDRQLKDSESLVSLNCGKTPVIVTIE